LIKKRGDDTAYEPPTIGPSLDGITQNVEMGGIAIDGDEFLVTKPFHQEFELYEMLTGQHTISNIIYCPRGFSTCNYVGIGASPISGDVSSSIWWIAIEMDHLGKWSNSVFDPFNHINDEEFPITFTAEKIEGDTMRISTSITANWNNIDTEPQKLWIQVRDNLHGVRNFYFNEGIQFNDKDAYPLVETAYDAPIKVEPLCLNESPYHRHSCAFDLVQDWTQKNAQDLLNEILNGNYIYDKYVRDRYYD